MEKAPDARDLRFTIEQLMDGCEKNPKALVALPALQLKEMINSAQWLIKCQDSQNLPSVRRAIQAFKD